MSHDHALPRVKRRPPPWWRVYWLLQMALPLDQCARIITQVERYGIGSGYTIFASIALGAWAFLYWRWRQQYRAYTRLEELGISIRPPDKVHWCILGFIWAVVGVLPWAWA